MTDTISLVLGLDHLTVQHTARYGMTELAGKARRLNHSSTPVP